MPCPVLPQTASGTRRRHDQIENRRQMTSMALTPTSTDPRSSMKAVRKGVFDPVARGLPGLDNVDNKKSPMDKGLTRFFIEE